MIYEKNQKYDDKKLLIDFFLKKVDKKGVKAMI